MIELDVREGAAKGERKITGIFRQVQETLTVDGAVKSDFDSSKKKAPKDPSQAEILDKLMAASIGVGFASGSPTVPRHRGPARG
jgi:hypothetical protein